MKRSFRFQISLIMTAVYLLVILAPLAPAALHSPFIAHALTGECSGDCRICGCSAERSSAGSCCCALKKSSENSRVTGIRTGSSCSKPPQPVKPAATCCSGDKKEPTATVEKHEHCNLHEKNTRETTITTAPCGSSKSLAFFGIEKIQHMPFEFKSTTPCQQTTDYRTPHTNRLISHHGDPPDPPPKISTTV